MTTALPPHETLDAVSNYVAAAGLLISMLAAAAVISTFVFKAVYTFCAFRALKKLT